MKIHLNLDLVHGGAIKSGGNPWKSHGFVGTIFGGIVGPNLDKLPKGDLFQHRAWNWARAEKTSKVMKIHPRRYVNKETHICVRFLKKFPPFPKTYQTFVLKPFCEREVHYLEQVFPKANDFLWWSIRKYSCHLDEVKDVAWPLITGQDLKKKWLLKPSHSNLWKCFSV